jgi:hypothetical protein
MTVEEIDDGQKLEFERSLETFMRRPDRVRANFEGPGGSKRFWYDGSTITLLGVEKKLYASSEAPATVDEALDFAMEAYGVTVPVADLLFSNPYESFMQNVKTGMYVGQSKVGNTTCHHLAFTQESVDWQIWLADDAQLVPTKLVITYKNVPGQPQYRAVFSNWNLAPRLPEALFGFEAPKEAEQIQFLSARE